MKNITARPIKIPSGEKVATVEPANVVPNMLAPKPQEAVTPLIGKSAKVGLEADTRGSNLKSRPRGSNKEPDKTKPEVDRTPLSDEQMKILLEKIDFKGGTKDWTPEQQEKGRAILAKYSFLFAMDSMDLGKTDLVKHHIELTNYTPIKD